MPPYSLLYIDDDPMAIVHMREIMKDFLSIVNPEYIGSPKKALSVHGKKKHDIVISDLRLGTTTGIELISKMKQQTPESAYLLASGDADLTAALAAVNDAKIIRFLLKPCKKNDLHAGLKDAKKYLEVAKKLEEIDIATTALKRSNIAVVSLDLNFKFIYANDPAKTLLAKKNIIYLSPTIQLTSAGMLTTTELHGKIRQSLFDKHCLSMPVPCPDQYGQHHLLLYCTLSEMTPQRPAHIDILILDPTNPGTINSAILANALHLSPGEANVVANLSMGLPIEEISKVCNLSVSTVRTYLKNAFAKTGTARQAEIVALALRACL